MGDLKGKKIRLSCTLNDRKGTLIAGPGSVLTIGTDVEESVATQLLAGDSARVVESNQPAQADA